MLLLGERTRFCNGEAIILVCRENEVLIFTTDGRVQWVDKDLLEVLKPA